MHRAAFFRLLTAQFSCLTSIALQLGSLGGMKNVFRDTRHRSRNQAEAGKVVDIEQRQSLRRLNHIQAKNV